MAPAQAEQTEFLTEPQPPMATRSAATSSDTSTAGADTVPEEHYLIFKKIVVVIVVVKVMVVAVVIAADVVLRLILRLQQLLLHHRLSRFRFSSFRCQNGFPLYSSLLRFGGDIYVPPKRFNFSGAFPALTLLPCSLKNIFQIH